MNHRVLPFTPANGWLQCGERADALVFFATVSQVKGSCGIDPQVDEHIRRFRERGVFTGDRHQVEIIPTAGDFPFVIVAGVGERPDSLQDWREAAALVVKRALQYKLASLAIAYDRQVTEPTGLTLEQIVYAVAEGLLLGGYRMKSYQHDLPAREDVREALHLVGTGTDLAAVERGVSVAAAYGEATNYARDLTNLPGNVLTPERLAQEAQQLAAQFGLECTVLDEREIAAHGMGGLAAVGQGSAHPPRMIALTYRGRDEWSEVLGLVGKGITFDTGGISLKKPERMEEMISDMGGAAVVLGALRAAARLKLPVNLVAVIPAAENMPSGSALKPGDIITTLSGRTVEVLNTDAEGRIVLADGITYAKRLGATRLVDVATLTGAVLVALGDVATGAVTNDDAFLRELIEASHRAGEKVWQLPAYPEYKEMLKSPVADVRNATADRWAGCITGGLFIGTFAEETPWIHLDTGGTAWLWNEKTLEPKGGTGTMVRTLVELIRGGASA